MESTTEIPTPLYASTADFAIERSSFCRTTHEDSDLGNVDAAHFICLMHTPIYTFRSCGDPELIHHLVSKFPSHTFAQTQRERKKEKENSKFF